MATIGALVYRVGLDVSELNENVRGVSQKLEGLGSIATKVAGSLGIGALIKSTVEFAGQLSDLSVKSGIGTTALQRLAAVADASGSSMEALANAAAMMGARIGGGDKSATAAIEKLGLKMTQLKNQDPGEVFLELSKRIAALPTHFERLAAAQDIFGKSGKDLLPTIMEVGKGVGEIGTMGPGTIKALDDMGDAFGNLWRSVKVGIAEAIGPLVPAFTVLAQAIGAATIKLGQFLGYVSQLGAAGPAGQLKGWWSDVKMLATGDVGLPGLPKGPGAPAGPALYSPMFGAGPGGADYGAAVAALTGGRGPAGLKAGGPLKANPAMWVWYLNSLTGGLTGAPGAGITSGGPFDYGPGVLGSRGLPGALSMLQAPGAGLRGNTFATGGGFNWGGFSGGLSTTILGALMGGGNVGQAAGGFLGGTAGTMLGSMAAKGIGGTLGSVIGSVIPGLGTMLGGLVGPLFGKLFGPSQGKLAGMQADKDIGSIQQQLLGQFGSLENIGAQGAIGQAVVGAWGDKNVAGLAHFKGLVDGLNQSLAKTQQLTDLKAQYDKATGWEAMAAAAEKYGISVDTLGARFVQLKDNDFATELISDFELLTNGGADMGGVLEKMGKSFNALVTDARKWGISIPENLRPAIEELARTNQLFDEAGNTLTDLSGIQWGPAVKTQAQIMKESIDGLTEAINNLAKGLGVAIPNAAADAAKGIRDQLGNIDINIPYRFSGEEATPFAAGGIVTRPTYALIGERGPEAVIPLSAWGGGREQRIVLEVSGRVLAETVIREAPQVLSAYGM